jgi:hypothetical protein
MLFKKTIELVEYAELSNEINFISITATLRMVEEQHIISVLGKEQYNDLNDTYQAATDETTLSDENKNLLHQCRMVIGPYVCYYYAPKAEIKLTDGGARRMETATAKTAFQYQVTKFRDQNLAEAEAATELLLQFLEENKDDYDLWQNSSAFKEYRSLFIKTAKEFNELFPSHSPYRNYWAMRSTMEDVEENNIRDVIGDELFDDLKTKDTGATDLTDVEEKLLQKLKKAIAYFTVSFSIPFLNVSIAANGITVATTNRALNEEVSGRGFAADNPLSALMKQSQANGQSWIKNALKYLNDPENEGAFTGWPIEVPETKCDDKRYNTINRDSKGSFGLY